MRLGPAISVVVPVYRQWHLVPGLLDGLRRQSVSAAEFEVILVDNASPDFVAPTHPAEHVTIVRCDRPGSYAARNAGAKRARGALLVFTDADCVPSPGWLAAFQARGGVDRLLAGRVEVVPGSERPSLIEIFELVKGIPQDRYVAHGYAATANLAVPRTVFEELGGFDGSRFSGGDAEFCRRAARAGRPVAYVPEAEVRHPARATWAEVATKARRVRGGQMVIDTPWRYRSFAGTLASPVLSTWRFAWDQRHPLRYRGVAVLVAWAVCLVEIVETVRLRLGRGAERR